MTREERAAALILQAVKLLASGDPWVPHKRWPWPTRVSLRKARELGARKDGRLYYLRQSAIDAAMEAMAPVAPTCDDLEAASRQAARRSR